MKISQINSKTVDVKGKDGIWLFFVQNRLRNELCWTSVRIHQCPDVRRESGQLPRGLPAVPVLGLQHHGDQWSRRLKVNFIFTFYNCFYLQLHLIHVYCIGVYMCVTLTLRTSWPGDLQKYFKAITHVNCFLFINLYLYIYYLYFSKNPSHRHLISNLVTAEFWC